jgi:hypothetical protein
MVVPVTENEIGYRPLLVTNIQLRKILKDAAENGNRVGMDKSSLALSLISRSLVRSLARSELLCGFILIDCTLLFVGLFVSSIARDYHSSTMGKR